MSGERRDLVEAEAAVKSGKKRVDVHGWGRNEAISRADDASHIILYLAENQPPCRPHLRNKSR